MEQLRMQWKHDGMPAQPLSFPENFSVVTLPDLENAVDIWLDMMQYGLSEKREDLSYYQTTMLDIPGYEEEKCYFILEDGKPVATITLICDSETQNGVVHMVGSNPACRGKGIGNMLGDIAVYVLKTAGMQTASLKTDDFRIPAIKAYLRAGFQPELSTEDFVQRWDAIYQKLGLQNNRLTP